MPLQRRNLKREIPPGADPRQLSLWGSGVAFLSTSVEVGSNSTQTGTKVSKSGSNRTQKAVTNKLPEKFWGQIGPCCCDCDRCLNGDP